MYRGFDFEQLAAVVLCVALLPFKVTGQESSKTIQACASECNPGASEDSKGRIIQSAWAPGVMLVSVTTLKSPAGIVDVEYNQKAKYIAAIDEKGHLTEWSAKSYNKLFTVDNCPSKRADIEYSPSGSHLAFVTFCRNSRFDNPRQAKLTVIESTTGKLEKQFSLESTEGAISLCFSPDGKTIATAGHQKRLGTWLKSIWLWDIASGLHESIDFGPAEKRRGGIIGVRYCNKGKNTLLATKYDYQKKTVGEQIRQSLKNGVLAESTVMLWDMQRNEMVWTKTFLANTKHLPGLVQTIDLYPMSPAIAMNNNNTLMAVGLQNGQIDLYRFPSMEFAATVSTEMTHHDLSMCFDERDRLIVAHGQTMRLWSTDARKMLLIDERRLDASITALSAGAKAHFISGDRNGVVTVWKIEDSNQ